MSELEKIGEKDSSIMKFIVKKYALLPKNLSFQVWFWSIIAFLILFILGLSRFSETDIHGTLLFFSTMVGVFSFGIWIFLIIANLLFKDRRKGLMDAGTTLIIIVCFFALLFAMPPMNPVITGNIQKVDEVIENKESSLSKIYYFDDDYPPEQIYLHDLSIDSNPRRFYVYIFDKNIESIDDEAFTELRIEKDGQIVFKFYGNNAYVEELQSICKSDNECTESTVNFKNSNFEKQARVFSMTKGHIKTEHFLFSFGGIDYLITAEWNVENNKVYQELTNKMIATLAPTTVSRGYYEQISNDDLPPTEPESTPQELHLVDCFVDKNGKFDIFYTECEEMANLDIEGFRTRATEICLDGRSPLFAEQGNKEQREKICADFFSQDPFPIANIP